MGNFRFVWRSLMKHPGYTAINLSGLVLGLTTFLAIFLYVRHETSFDAFHADAERIVRVEYLYEGPELRQHWAATEGFVRDAMVQNFPEVEQGLKIFPVQNPYVIRHGDAQYSERWVTFADSAFFDFFSVEAVEGDLSTALQGTSGAVLTRSTAKKYFGDEPAIGKVLNVGSSSTFTVNAVIEDFPAQSHLKFDLLLSLAFMRNAWPALDGRGASSLYTYLKLRDASEVPVLQQKLEEDTARLFFPDYDLSEEERMVFLLRPIRDIHLHSNAEKELQPNGNAQAVWILSVAGLFVLVIACVNYMNLATARSMKRAREIGMKKVIGARASQIAFQFLGESLVLVAVAFVVSAVALMAVIPQINALTGTFIAIGDLFQGSTPWLLAGVFMAVSLLSGAYPAVYLSRFQPSAALRAHRGDASTGMPALRKGLVVAQFALSVFLIISAVTMSIQMDHIRGKNIGFDKEQVVVLPISGPASARRPALKQELQGLESVVAVSASTGVPGKRIVILSSRVPSLAAADPDAGNIAIRTINTDVDFVKAMGLQLVAGHDFSLDRPSEIETGFILNEAAVRAYNLTEPVGAEWEYTYALQEPKRGRVIGVVRDFDYSSVHSEVEPVVIHVHNLALSNLSVRVKPGADMPQVLSQIEQAWKAVVPELPFEYGFLDETYEQLYRSETVLNMVMGVFTLLAVVIACLGLYGLAAFTTEQRTREIGIRKVLGASTRSLIAMLAKEFVWIVVIGSALALVPAWWLMGQWLENFVYRVDLSPWVFLVCAAAAVVLAYATVAWRAWKASVANPVSTLRAE